MKCTKCNTSCLKTPLYRTKPIGEDPEWMCMSCLKIHEPELAKNLVDDGDAELANIIANQNSINKKRNRHNGQK